MSSEEKTSFMITKRMAKIGYARTKNWRKEAGAIKKKGSFEVNWPPEPSPERGVLGKSVRKGPRKDLFQRLSLRGRVPSP